MKHPNLADQPTSLRRERRLGVDSGKDFGGRNDVVHAPAVAVTHIHVLNEADLSFVTAAELDEINQLVIIEAAHHNCV